MTCSVPGCPDAPAHDEPVKAAPAGQLWHLEEPRGVALTHLCDTHRAEFEALGWLAPREEETEE